MPPRTRTIHRLIAVAATAALAACSDAPTGPGAPAAATRAPDAATASVASTVTALTAPIQATGLRRLVPLTSDSKFSFTTTRAGGTYVVPGTGLTVTVPANAIPAANLTITVRAVTGSTVAYKFGPHGTQFAAPLTLSQDVALTNYALLLDKSKVVAGYFADSTMIDPAANVATVSELLSVRKDFLAPVLRFEVRHFSGYMLSTGRR